MAGFTVSISSKDLLGVAASYGLTARQLKVAVVGAVNDVAKTARNQTRREIRKYLNLPARSVSSRVEFVKRASRDNPTAVVVLDRKSKAGNSRPTLMSFGGKPKLPRREGKRTKTGKLTKTARARFSYQLLKKGPRRFLPGAFVQRPTRRYNLQTATIEDIGGGQKAQAFRRRGRGRFPLVVPRGPSIAAVWQNRETKIARTVQSGMNGRLLRRVSGRAKHTIEKQIRKVHS